MNATRDRRPIDILVRPIELFAHDKIAGAILLMVATAIALAWANSPWADSYRGVLATRASVAIGAFAIDKPLSLWINDGLMGVFFFVVGLEIKREILAGELSSVRKAVLPLAGALGGMALPTAVYLLFNASGAGRRGWGVPMATDIAFALGILLLAGPRVPVGLKVFLTALAILDDIGAIVVIAAFYTDGIVFGSLVAGGALLLLSAGLNVAGARSSIVYFVIGTLVWVAFLKSGVHATLAAVLMAMTIPASSRVDGRSLIRRLDETVVKLKNFDFAPEARFLTAAEQLTLHQTERSVKDATAPLQELEHALLPIVTFVVMPVFALANAGVAFSGGVASGFSDPIVLGIIFGLFIGKQAGIFGASAIVVKLGWADLPDGVSWRQLHAVSILGGIGFTMSLFVATLAFSPDQQERAKLGILVASAVSASVGSFLLMRSRPAPSTQ